MSAEMFGFALWSALMFVLGMVAGVAAGAPGSYDSGRFAGRCETHGGQIVDGKCVQVTPIDAGVER